MSNKRYDVLIIKLGESMVVDSIAGENMPLSSGSFYTAEKRFDTVSMRLNNNYACMIVDAGKFKAGDTINSEDATED